MTLSAPGPRCAARVVRRIVPLLAVCAAVRPASAQQGEGASSPPPASRWPIDLETAPRPVTHAIRATGRIQVDARLDEPAWSAATPLTEFVQSQPHPGYPATKRTAVRILYDERH